MRQPLSTFNFPLSTFHLPFLSVIIPHYNSVALLARCLRSLMAAGLGDGLQVIVVDDGSSQEQRQQVVSLIESFSSSGTKDSLSLSSNSKNCGASASRNRGLLSAKGRFVWFVDADDEVDSEMLKLWWSRLKELDGRVELLHIGPMVSCHTDITDCTDLSVVQKTVADMMKPRTHCLDHTTYWISREFLVKNPEIRYLEDVEILEDSIFVLQLLDRARDIVAADNCCLYIRHNDGHSLTAGKWSKEKSARFLPSIFLFFSHLSAFMHKHSNTQALYHRYCYVYMRVLAVKGVPNALYIELFYNPVIRFGFTPRNLKERLLKNPTIHAILSSLCRLLRPSHD